MDIKKSQKKVDDWIKKYGVRYFDIMTNMAILTEEVGEVARVISRQYGEQSIKKIINLLNCQKNCRMCYLWFFVLRTRQT